MIHYTVLIPGAPYAPFLESISLVGIHFPCWNSQLFLLGSPVKGTTYFIRHLKEAGAQGSTTLSVWTHL